MRAGQRNFGGGHARPRSSRRGMTIIELLVAMAILAVAVSLFTSMVVATSRQRGINRENWTAVNAAQVMVERMRNEDFRDVFPMFNEDPDDDPEGAGTAPGHRFAVAGLGPLASSPDGLVGEVRLPAREITVAVPGGGGSGPVFVGGVGGGGFTTEFQLREDLVDEALGLPRDLNGDSIIDDQNHAGDYIILPVHVSIEWKGRFGPRRLDVYSQITTFSLESR